MVVAALNGGLLIIVAGFALVWVLFLRPQQARQKAARTKSDTLAPGDEVLTVGGLYGIVQEIEEEGDLIVEIAEGIHVRIARRAVATVVKPDEDDADDADDAHEHDADEPEHAEATAPDTNPPPA
jgi:preprotein translocase subunit YajC